MGDFNENAAYTKLVFRIMVCGAKILRRLLTVHVKGLGYDLDVFLSSNKSKVLKGFIGQMNQGILFPPCLKSDLERWDICLLAHVLLTSSPRLPSTIISQLKDLRKIRNNIIHSEDARICENGFVDNWNELEIISKTLLVHINDPFLENEIKEDVKKIDTGQLLQDVADTYKAMFLWSQLDKIVIDKLDDMQTGKCILHYM